ncbi:UNVERIFIED_CONTAM: hypothetical protein Sradi_3055600 [Sesamum radiatum]|uniref:Prolamin-like domain-containing protein n=1 Tax=Sesamum radiatum TaxID=300843 RepID=A0AAW2RCY0_SESRA
MEGCLKYLKATCPVEQQVIVCKSVSLAFDLDLFCCGNAYRRLEKCMPSFYSETVKGCVYGVSLSLAMPPTLVNCASDE